MSNQVSSGKGNIKNMSLSFHTFFFLLFFQQPLKQMTRNVTGFLFLSEIKRIIRWKKKYGGVGGGRWWRMVEEEEEGGKAGEEED